MALNSDSIIFGKDSEEFKILSLIGAGGFGRVFKIQNNNGDSFAVKTLPTDFLEEELLLGLTNEAKQALNIKHNNVIDYLYFHDGSGHPELPPYLIMEYAEQGSLSELLKKLIEQKSKLGNQEIVKYFQQLVAGMQAINKTVIHRDIKPANILIKNNELKISDFGLSKLILEDTRSKSFKGSGTYRYMAPEAWTFDKNTIQMDIYSMGIVFYELATFNYPYQSINVTDPDSWRKAHLLQSAQNPASFNSEINAGLSQVILKMIEKSPSRRYQMWNEIADALNNISSAQPNKSKLIEGILKVKTEIDLERQEKVSKETNRRKEREEMEELIVSQFENDFIGLLKGIENDINSQNQTDKINLTKTSGLKYHLNVFGLNQFDIELKVLFDEDFIRKVPSRWGDGRYYTELLRPQVEGKMVLAWGFIKDKNRKGCNIILLENKEDIYGDWLLLFNTNSGFTNHERRAEPFPFEFHEIEEELNYIRAMHIYNTEIVGGLSEERIIKLIEDSIKKRL